MGVKYKWTFGWSARNALTSWSCDGEVVGNDVDLLAGRLAVDDLTRETDELGAAVAVGCFPMRSPVRVSTGVEGQGAGSDRILAAGAQDGADRKLFVERALVALAPDRAEPAPRPTGCFVGFSPRSRPDLPAAERVRRDEKVGRRRVVLVRQAARSPIGRANVSPRGAVYTS